MTPRTRRPAIRIGALALAAAFGAAIGAPAQAQAGFEATAEAVPVDSAAFQAYPNDTHQAGRIVVGIDPDEPHNADVTVSLSLIDDPAGLSFTPDDEHCTAAGSALTCDFPAIAVPWEATIDFTLDVTPEIEPHDVVDYEVSVQVDEDAVEVPGSWEFMPPADDLPEFHTSVAEDFEDVAPGSAVNPTITFKSVDEYAYDDVYLSWGGQNPYLTHSYLDTIADYSNCGVPEGGGVICVLNDLDADPGEVFEISPDTPVAATIAENAPGPMTFVHSYGVQAIGVWNQDLIAGIDYFDAETELVFNPSDGDLEGDSWMEVTSSAHPYDLDAADDTIAADAGEDATIEIAVENHGPADALPQPVQVDLEEFLFSMAFQLPTGVKAPVGDEHGWFNTENGHCRNLATKHYSEDPKPADFGLDRLDLICWSWEIVEAGDAVVFDVPVEVTANTPSNDGRAVVFDEHAGSEAYPIIDGDPANDTAVISLDRSGSGSLPTTGASLGAVGGAGALAIAAGMILFVLMRRRTAAAH